MQSGGCVLCFSLVHFLTAEVVIGAPVDLGDQAPLFSPYFRFSLQELLRQDPVAQVIPLLIDHLMGTGELSPRIVRKPVTYINEGCRLT